MAHTAYISRQLWYNCLCFYTKPLCRTWFFQNHHYDIRDGEQLWGLILSTCTTDSYISIKWYLFTSLLVQTVYWKTFLFLFRYSSLDAKEDCSGSLLRSYWTNVQSKWRAKVRKNGGCGLGLWSYERYVLS